MCWQEAPQAQGRPGRWGHRPRWGCHGAGSHPGGPGLGVRGHRLARAHVGLRALPVSALGGCTGSGGRPDKPRDQWCVGAAFRAAAPVLCWLAGPRRCMAGLPALPVTSCAGCTGGLDAIERVKQGCVTDSGPQACLTRHWLLAAQQGGCEFWHAAVGPDIRPCSLMPCVNDLTTGSSAPR